MAEEVEGVVTVEDRTVDIGSLLLRVVIALNFVRFALSFLPWFEGTENSAGIADQIFNPRHTDGFRSDFLWLFFSTILIFFAMFAFIPKFRRESKARINVFMCLAWLAAYFIYLWRSLVTGVLYFG
jgi:hypothetical protein